MKNFPSALKTKLDARVQTDSLRTLRVPASLVDFSSNDYLGFARSEQIYSRANAYLDAKKIRRNGATGSRLISGNHEIYTDAENLIADFHKTEAALIFNSGYDANVGFFSSVPQRGDIVLYDELCHASIRDGIRLSNATAYKFDHNDLDDLASKIEKFKTASGETYIATESVFSMDGDSPQIAILVDLARQYGCRLVIDEAHALGVFGRNGEGFIQDQGFEDHVFARIVTFGKGLGCHGAAVLGSVELHDYLINFARSFIYTTGLPPHSLATIIEAYKSLDENQLAIEKLRDNIILFSQEINFLGIRPLFVGGKSTIQSAIIPGNKKVRAIAEKLQGKSFDVRAILSPTVPEGQERLRFCLHSYNSEAEIREVLALLATFVLG
ncbi:MAG TPA: 8-amino-7-oxononanoate synthase [Flavobacterium sp.]|jgi:8-amino-7-oxononanoate synthase